MHIINLLHQPLLSILVWNYRSINSFIVLSVCYSSCSKTLPKTVFILPLWKISFSSEKGSPSMWLQMRSWNVFSLLNGTNWKIFCLLLSLEPPWGHPSRWLPAHKASLKKTFLICQAPVLHGREGCLELLGNENEPGHSSCKRSQFVMGTKIPVMLCCAMFTHNVCEPSRASDGVWYISDQLDQLDQIDQFPNHVVAQSQPHGELVLPKYLHHIFQWLSLKH